MKERAELARGSETRASAREKEIRANGGVEKGWSERAVSERRRESEKARHA